MDNFLAIPGPLIIKMTWLGICPYPACMLTLTCMNHPSTDSQPCKQLGHSSYGPHGLVVPLGDFSCKLKFYLWTPLHFGHFHACGLPLKCAKKVVSDSPGLVDFAIGLAIFVLKLPDGQELFFGEIQITEGLQSILLIKKGFWAS